MTILQKLVDLFRRRCRSCRGSGRVRYRVPANPLPGDPFELNWKSYPCSRCNGTGRR